MLIDTHCHLNFPDKFPDPAATIAEAKVAGVEKFVVVGCDPESSQMALNLADEFEEIYAVVGWHPTYTSKYTRESLDLIEEMAQHPKVVAIGEIGLDFHWDYSTPAEQMVALIDQLDLAKKLDKPIVFHAREAYPALLDVLEARERQPCLLHCFAGDHRDAERAVALGSYFGVDGPLTYKKADDLRSVIASLPRDRVVIETDSPYLPPVPYRGKPNTPAYIVHINETLASLWGVTPSEAADMTTENAERYFSLKRAGIPYSKQTAPILG